MNKRLKSNVMTQGGYTLVELLVAMSIFTVVLITGLGSFVSVSTSANKAGAQRKVQQDARFNLEEVARQTRSSAINYEFYAGKEATPCGIPQGKVLALKYTIGDDTGEAAPQFVFYYRDEGIGGITSNKLFRYLSPAAAPTCGEVLSSAATNHESVTGENLTVSEAKFLISPGTDPAVGGRVHPRATLLLTVQTGGGASTVTEQSRSSAITVQTSVSTRVYAITPKEVGAG